VLETASASVTPRTWPTRAGIVASSSSKVLLVCRVATGTLSASTVTVGSVDGSRRPPRTRIRAVHGTLRSSPASGISARSAVHAKVNSPYNLYTHKGLPPTPISNPGSAAMSAAIHPAPGNWIYYVNSDAAGHLYFTASDTDFAKAVARCRANHWGCA